MFYTKCYRCCAYILISTLFLQCSVFHVLSYGSDNIFPNSAEIIRRRKIVEPYLLKIHDREKNWIETHLMITPGIITASHLKTKESHTSQDKQELHFKISALKDFQMLSEEYMPEISDSAKINNLFFSTQDSEYYISDSEPVLEESNKMTSDEVTHRSNSFKSFLLEYPTIEKDSDSYHNSKPTSEKMRKASESIEKSSSTENDNHPLSSGDELHSNSHDVENSMVSVPSLKDFEHTNNYQLNARRDIKEDLLKLQAHPKDSEEKLNLEGKEHKLTERDFLEKEYKLVNNWCFHNENKDIVCNKHSRIKDSIYQTKFILRDSFIEKNEKLYKPSNLESDIKSNEFIQKTGESRKNLQQKSNILEKHEGDISLDEAGLDKEKSISVQTVKDLPFSESVNTVDIALPKNLKNNEVDELLMDSGVCHRKKKLCSFISMLHKNQKDWIETYHFNYRTSDPTENNNLNVKPMFGNYIEVNNMNNKDSKRYSHEISYIIRWVNILRNKHKISLYNSLFSVNTLSIPFSIDVLNNLEDATKSFDITSFDELISSLILNSTLHNSYASTLQFDFAALNYNSIYIFLAFFFLAYFFFFPGISSFLKLVFITCIWHANKTYQQKIAEKHNIMSKIPPDYCESILKHESGFLAHIKEYYRHWWYGEDCKRYYEAVMIDPVAEISLPVVLADLVADVFCQVFQPFGRAMNTFFKDLTYGLSYFQQVYIFVLLIVILIVILVFYIILVAVLREYKVNFPFFMGSIEPTKCIIGSKVEDIKLDKEDNILQNSPATSNILSNCCTENCFNCCNEFISRENSIQRKNNCFHTTKQNCPSFLSPKTLLHKTYKEVGRRASI